MRRGIVIFGVVVATLSVATPPATAQTEPVRVRTTAGIDGYVDPGRPLEITVEIEADVLFVGSIEASAANTTVLLDVEVPAGSRKTYTLVLPSPTQGPVTRIRLLADDGTELVRERVNVEIPSDRILVGLVRSPGLRSLLASLRDPITEMPITPVELTEIPDRRPNPLGYLVVPRGVDLPPSVVDWTRDGGRLVLEGDTVDTIDGLTAFGSVPGAAATRWFGLERGEVVAVDSLDTLDGDEWTAILRPVPIALGAPDPFQTPERPLIQAAAGAGSQRVPSLPWLAAALVGYAIVVGPVNFWLLRRTRRRDAAWVTIPVISVVAVVGFWVAGRQRLEAASLSHASVQVLGQEPESRTALVLATGVPAEYRVDPPDGWEAYPANVFGEFGFASVSGRITSSGTFVFDLPQLGAAGIQARHDADPALAPEVSVDQDNVTVANTTDVGFWAWGVVRDSKVQVGPAPLPAGDDAILVLGPEGRFEPEFGADIADAVISTLRLWESQERFDTLYSLATAAAWIDLGPSYFFGFTRDADVDIVVDGDPVRVKGETLVIVPLGLAGPDGAASGEIVGAPAVAFVDRGPGFTMVQAPELVLEFRAPADLATDPRLVLTRDAFVRPSLLEVWDWVDGGFVETSFGEPLDRFRFVAPSGSVIVKMGSGEGEFGDGPLSPDFVRLVWEEP